MNQNKVNFGASSKLLLTAFLASLVPFVTQLMQTGEVPTKEAVLSGALVGLLAVLRVAQQIVLDIQNPPVQNPDDTDAPVDEPPTEPTDVPVDVVKGQTP